MRKWRGLLNNEQGVAIVLAVMVLLVLTGILMAFLSVSALEPQISRNVADTARARYLAAAGIEIG
jgi:Tfp pilus assembly protein PilX